VPFTSIADKFDDSGQHRVLVVDDLRDNVTILRAFLKHHNYTTFAAHSGKDAIEMVEKIHPDLILLDLNMPGMNGMEVLTHLRTLETLDKTGIILLTASGNVDELLEAFSIGADDFIQKPYHHIEMLARIQSVLKMRDTQMKLLEVNRRLDEFNQDLEVKVADQVLELEKVNRLRRFFSPQIAETFLAGDVAPFANIRQQISVVFLDLRNFTSFAEKQDPDTVMNVLSTFHSTVGPVIFKHNATLERFTGDGLMCFIGAPHAEPQHASIAFDMAKEMQQKVSGLSREWMEKGFDLQMGIGISSGEASTGTIGFEKRLDYAAIGSVTNLSARLCSVAEGGEILMSRDSYDDIGDKSSIEAKGKLELKGFSQKIEVFSCRL